MSFALPALIIAELKYANSSNALRARITLLPSPIEIPISVCTPAETLPSMIASIPSAFLSRLSQAEMLALGRSH